MSSFLSAAENAAWQSQTFDVIFKKMGKESTRAVELTLEAYRLFISGWKYNFKPKLTKEQVRSQSY